MQPVPEEPAENEAFSNEASPDLASSNGDTLEDASSELDRRDAGAGRRAVIALAAYAALAVLAGIRLDGRPRLVVWLFLGLFAVKTLLMVLKQRTN